MELNITNILLFVAGQLVTGAAIWGAIRADIRNMITRIERVEKAADDAHHRIDRILEGAQR